MTEEERIAEMKERMQVLIAELTKALEDYPLHKDIWRYIDNCHTAAYRHEKAESKIALKTKG